MKIILILFQLTQQYLLMQPIQKSLITGNFSEFQQICRSNISVNIEIPFQLKGYLYIGKFIEEMSSKFLEFNTKRMELSSQHIEDNFAIQSYDLLIKNKKSEKVYLFKFIFFMSKDEVNITTFDQNRNQIYFRRDPKWKIGSEFEVTGATHGINDGWYRIVDKIGSAYSVKKKEPPLDIVSETQSSGRAKAWKIYYLRGLSI